MEVKTKLFYQDGNNPIDVQINDFLSKNKLEFIDVKFTGVENNINTQASVMALLIYRVQE